MTKRELSGSRRDAGPRQRKLLGSWRMGATGRHVGLLAGVWQGLTAEAALAPIHLGAGALHRVQRQRPWHLPWR